MGTRVNILSQDCDTSATTLRPHTRGVPITVVLMRDHTASLRPRTRGLLLTSLVAAAALGMAGCSVAFEPTAAPSSPAPSSPESPSVPVDNSPTDSGTGDSGAGDSGTDDGDRSLPTRAEWEPKVSGTVSCVDGRADITADISVLELAADCDEVTVSGTGSVILAAHVGRLSVRGDTATIIVASADAVDVAGVGNVVLWESGTPVVSDTGDINVVLPAEGN